LKVLWRRGVTLSTAIAA